MRHLERQDILMTITADAPVAARPTLAPTGLATAPSFPAYEELGDPTERALAAIVRRVASDPSQWAHLVRLGPQRAWARIEVPEGIDVWVISWPTFEATELHSHGDATAAFAAVVGAITEIRPDAAGRLVPRTFAPGVVQVIRPGDVHDVRNERVTPAVTIHAYSPRLTTMNFYRWDAGRLFLDHVVHSDDPEAGAW